MKRNTFFNFLVVGILSAAWIVGGSSSKAQSLEGLVVEGERFDNILIGKSTERDVIAAYGDKYKLIDHRGYSYEMIYKNLGLSFYYCQADENKEIFVVEIEPPSRAVTSKGIKLGESTFADVFRFYGEWNETSSGFEYEEDGIYFHYEEDTDDEDDEDARTKSKVETPVKKPETTGLTIDNTSDTPGNAVIDNPNNSDRVIDEESDEIKPRDDDEIKKKIVRRIELIEKGALRQCDSKFPKN